MRGLLNVCVKTYDHKINGTPTTTNGHFSYQYFNESRKQVKIYIDAFRGIALKTGDVFECTSFQSVFAAQ